MRKDASINLENNLGIKSRGNSSEGKDILRMLGRKFREQERYFSAERHVDIFREQRRNLKSRKQFRRERCIDILRSEELCKESLETGNR